MQNKFAGLSDKERLQKLATMPDEDIDYSDIPNMSGTKGWKKLYPNTNNDTVITDKMNKAKYTHEEMIDNMLSDTETKKARDDLEPEFARLRASLEAAKTPEDIDD